MRTYVEKLKKYYNSGKLTKTEIDNLYAKGKLTEEEYNYIIASD